MGGTMVCGLGWVGECHKQDGAGFGVGMLFNTSLPCRLVDTVQLCVGRQTLNFEQ